MRADLRNHRFGSKSFAGKISTRVAHPRSQKRKPDPKSAGAECRSMQKRRATQQKQCAKTDTDVQHAADSEKQW